MGTSAYSLAVMAGVAVGVYIRREALGFTFYADDYAQLEMLAGHYPVVRSAYDLFNFSDGTVAEVRRLMEVGFFPWWADPELRLVMLRPLASLMTWFDHRLFGNDPFGYHVHSALWWCVMLVTVGAFYARVLPRRQAGIAFMLLVCSVTSGVPFWWICNRSVLITTTFSLVALLAYRRHRIAGSPAMLGLAVSICSIAFLFGEYAFCALGYFVGFELCCGLGPLKRRAFSLAVMFSPAAMFIAVRTVAHASVRNSGIYLDPFGEPLAFLAATLVRVPVFVGDLLLVLQADHWTAAPPWIQDWTNGGWVPRDWLVDPSHWRVIQVVIGWMACVVAGLIWRCTCRDTRRAATRWLSVGSVLSIIPVVASFPSSRLLVMAAIGFSPLLAAFILDGLTAAQDRTANGMRRCLLASSAACLLVYHIVVPVTLQRAIFSNPMLNGIAVRDAMLQLDVDEAELPRQDLILLSAFESGSSMYLPATRRVNGRTAPRSCMYLSFVPAPYLLTRDTDSAFSIRFTGATTMLHSAVEELFRASHRPLKLLNPIDVGPFRATIMELQDGLPKRVQFAFDHPLDSPSLVFMITAPDGFKRFRLPPIGGTVEVPAPAVPAVQ